MAADLTGFEGEIRSGEVDDPDVVGEVDDQDHVTAGPATADQVDPLRQNASRREPQPPRPVEPGQQPQAGGRETVDVAEADARDPGNGEGGGARDHPGRETLRATRRIATACRAVSSWTARASRTWSRPVSCICGVLAKTTPAASAGTTSTVRFSSVKCDRAPATRSAVSPAQAARRAAQSSGVLTCVVRE